MKSEAYKQRQKEWAANYRLTHPAEVKAANARAYVKRQASATPKVRKSSRPENHRLRTYQLTEAAYYALMESQQGCCAICRTPLSKPCVDHDHTTGKVRGILCGTCNSGIGMLKDSPELLTQAAAYIRASASVQ